MDISLEKAEKTLLEQVKFVNLMLQECRRRNKFLQDELGMTYAKLVGLGTPYEEAINCLRKVKAELDGCLTVMRQEMVKYYDKKFLPKRRKF